MKLKLILTAALALACLAPAIAQTNVSTNAPVNTSPTTASTTNSVPQNAFDVLATAETWATSFNTNLTTFTASKLDLWTGMNYQHGLNVSAEIGGQYNLWGPVSVEAIARNVGVGGDLMSGQGGIGVHVIHYDLKVTGYVDGGFNAVDGAGYVEAGVRFQKAISQSTFLLLGVGVDGEFHKTAGINTVITVGVGASF